MKKFISDFKEFALKGNIVDMAVGVIIGGAFQAIVTALINDLIMPFIGLLTGGINFADQFLVLKAPEGVDAAAIKSIEQAKELGATTFNYGSFITAVINFIIINIFLELGRTRNIFSTGSLRATGDTIYPVVIGVTFQWLIAVGVAYIFGFWCGFGLLGIWCAFALDENTRGVILTRRWHSKKWAGKSFAV